MLRKAISNIPAPPLLVENEVIKEKYECGTLHLSMGMNERSPVNYKREKVDGAKTKLKQSRKATEKKRVWTRLSNGLYAWRTRCVPKKLYNDENKSTRPEQSPPWMPAEINTFKISSSIKPGSKRTYENQDLDFGDILGGRMKKERES